MVNEITEAIERIDPKQVFNVSQMRRERVFPWLTAKSPMGYVNAILDDKLGGNVLKAKITGTGRGRDYRIKGQNIINFLIAKAKYADNKND